MKKAYYIILLLNCLNLSVLADDFSGYKNYVYDSSDFATEYIDYDPNGIKCKDFLNWLPLNDPGTVLGRPTIDITGDDWYFPEDVFAPVNPVCSAFRYNEILFLGEEGYITVKFDHPVRDDENNPYGIDLIVYGNATQVIGCDQGWVNGDPASVSVGSNGSYEPGVVSVSQDGVTWYSFTNDPAFKNDDPNFVRILSTVEDGPFCDSFAPTLGRVYVSDANLADRSLGDWNNWWAEPTNPTLPVDPNLGFDSFAELTVAQICTIYGNSAGGTGYDIGKLDLPIDASTGKKWIQYVRVDDRAGGGSAEIDAFADVSSCGDWKHPYPLGDITNDCRVNLEDFAFLAEFWLDEVAEGDDLARLADIEMDSVIDDEDLVLIIDNWLACSWDCD